MLINRQVILAKPEVTYNTDSVPVAATNAILTEGITKSAEGLSLIQRPAIQAGLHTVQPIYGGQLEAFSFGVEVKGSGAAGTPPEIDPLLRCCGFGSPVIVASTSVTYTPVSSGQESATLYRFVDGKRQIVTGCRGNVTFTWTARDKLLANFSVVGHHLSELDVALPAPTYDTSIPVALIGIPFTFGGYSAIINSFTLDMGETVSTPANLAAPDGFAEVRLTKRNIVGTMDPEDQLIATKDFRTLFTTAVQSVVVLGPVGATAGNRVTLNAPKAYFTGDGEADRDGILVRNMGMGFAINTGDDEISLAFT